MENDNKLFKNRALKTKMVIVIAILTVIVCIINISISSYIMNRYEDKYYNKVLDTTKMFSMAIEDILEDNDMLIKGITENVLFMQMYHVDYVDVSMEMLKRLTFKNNELVGVWLIGEDNRAQIIANVKSIDALAVVSEAGVFDGTAEKNKWFSIERYPDTLFKIIETTEAITGDILYAVDLNTICNDYDNAVNVKDNSEFIIYYKHKKVFGQEDVIPEYTDVTEYIGEKQIVEIDNNGKKQILSRYYSTKSGLYYVCVSDHNDLFKGINTTRTILDFVLIIAVLLSLFIGSMFAQSVLRPLNKLARRMTSIQVTQNIDEYIDETAEYTDDEIGILNRYFDSTILKVKELNDENLEKQKLLQETRYHALQLQIRPHFLYNTLETVKCLGITGQKKELCKVIDDLGNLLRKSLSGTDLVSLEEELALLHHYVNIQKVRYDERFEYVEELSEDVLRRSVPKMILQPIVENSINYGVDSTDDKCIVSIKSAELEDHFQIIISDNGPGIDKEFLRKLKNKQIQPKGLGIGLANIDARLKLVYGEDYGLYISSIKGEGTTVVIRIPKDKRTRLND